MYYFMDSGLKFNGLVSLNMGGIVADHNFPILDILSRSGDIDDQSLKLCKIDPNLACFWPQIFRGQPPNFWTCIIKRIQIVITW